MLDIALSFVLLKVGVSNSEVASGDGGKMLNVRDCVLCNQVVLHKLMEGMFSVLDGELQVGKDAAHKKSIKR